MRTLLLVAIMVFSITSTAAGKVIISPPRLTNSPRLDVIVTNNRPLLSVFNATGGMGELTYTFQIDSSPHFDSPGLRTYSTSETQRVTSMRIPLGDELSDQTSYFWRVMATDSEGNRSPWGTEAGDVPARFLVALKSDDHWEGLLRTPIESVTSSGGTGVLHLIDQGDLADKTFWEGQPELREQWIEFDLGKPRIVSRIWLLTETESLHGRLQDYIWEYSTDKTTWLEIAETRTVGADGFRHIHELTMPVTGRFFRLQISDWHGKIPRISEVTLYSPEPLAIPQIPEGKYILVIGDRHDGTGSENILELITQSKIEAQIVTLPYWVVSREVVSSFSHAPQAIVLSGLGRNYETLPMFEFSGVFELIREGTVPILGICGGHQLLAMSAGYSFVRQMGIGYYTESIVDLLAQDVVPIKMLGRDQVLDGLPNPFSAVERHSWEVAVVPAEYEVLAASNCIEVLKHARKPIYGEQFHGEINAPFNVGRLFTLNFLRLAMKSAWN